MTKRFLIAGLILAMCVTLNGCGTVAQFVADTATSASSSTPSQIKSLAEADHVADLVVIGMKAAVDTGKLDAATLTELQALRAGLRSALDDLHKAAAAGNSLTFASFNAALNAYQAYATTKGIGH